MIILIVGLAVFLSVHSIRMVAPDWRHQIITVHGEKAWRGLYSALSLMGLVLIIWGYGMSRAEPVFIWYPQLWTYYLNALLTGLAFILLTAAYVPENYIKAVVKHPMFLAIKLWAFGHLISNGRAGDILLFGSFLIWSVIGFRVARRRPLDPDIDLTPSRSGTVLTLVFAVINYCVFAFYLHRVLIGVPTI